MLADTVDHFKAKMHGLAFAYRRVFEPKSPYSYEVLKDLAQFCRAHESTFHADARLHAVLEGRREVWLKIERMLKLTSEELYQLHKVKELKGNQGANSGG